jgi:hypothetical protein
MLQCPFVSSDEGPGGLATEPVDAKFARDIDVEDEALSMDGSCALFRPLKRKHLRKLSARKLTLEGQRSFRCIPR